MGRDFKLTVHDERADVFTAVFGSSSVFVTSPYAETQRLDGLPEPESVYMLDLTMIDDQTHDRLVAYLANKFHESAAEITKEIGERGMPIRAINTTITISNPQKWLVDSNTPYDESEEDQFDSYDDGYA
jgi:hypothetical protein